MKYIGCLALCLAALPAFPAEEAKTPRTDLYGDPLPPGVVARLGSIRLRHAHSDVVFSKDGKQLISCGRDGEVRVWDATTGKLLRRTHLERKPKMDDRISHVRLSPSGTTVAATDYHQIYLYDTNTSKEHGQFLSSNSLFEPLLPFSPDGKRLAVLDSKDKGSLLYLWDRNRGKKQLTLANPCAEFKLSACVFSPDGKRLAALVVDSRLSQRYLCLWDTATGKLLAKKDKLEHVNESALAFSPDGSTLAVGKDFEKQVALLDATNFKKQAVLKAPASINAEFIEQLTFSPNGRWLAGTYSQVPKDKASDKPGILIWDQSGATKPRWLPGQRNLHLAFAPDSQTLLCHPQWDGLIERRDVASGRPLQYRPGHDRPVRALAASPDGRTIVSANDTSILLWQTASGKPLRRLEGCEGGAHACAFSSDGKHFFALTSTSFYDVPNACRMWEVAEGKIRQRFDAPEWVFRMRPITFGDNGKRLAAVADKLFDDPPRRHLLVWDFATGKELLHRPYELEKRVFLAPPNKPVTKFEDHAAFTLDGERVTVWLGDRVGIAEVATGQLLARLPRDVGKPSLYWQSLKGRTIAFSPDGQFLTAPIMQRSKNFRESDTVEGLSLIESCSGEAIFHREGDFLHAAFRPDSRELMILDRKSLAVWDTDSGERLAEMTWPEQMKDHDGEPRVASLLVLPDGRPVTGMDEGDVLVWDVPARSWWSRPLPEPNRAQLVALWSDLRADAARAHRAMKTLRDNPTATVAFLQKRLRGSEEGKRLAALVAELDSDRFETREAASRELRRCAFRAAALLRRAFARPASPESRRRIKAILDQPQFPTAEDLRLLRTIAVLERIDTPEARRILEKLGGGVDAPETHAAKMALQRLKRRDASVKEKTSP